MELSISCDFIGYEIHMIFVLLYESPINIEDQHSLSSWYIMYQEAMTYHMYVCNCRLACVHTSNNTLNRNWISIYMYKPSSALSSTVQLVLLLHHLCLHFIFIL